MRASRGLKWENKMYKPKRSIRRHLRGLSDCLTYLDHGSRQNDLNDTANDDKCEDNQSSFFLLGVHDFFFLCHEVFITFINMPGSIS